MTSRSLAKDFYRLQKNIASFTNGEAKITEFDDDLSSFDVQFNIKDGYYKRGQFLVNIQPFNYPKEAPCVSFNTRIYHPNIDDGFCSTLVCLNLLEGDWTENNDLEDLVHALLFLIKTPNFSDPLNPLFGEEDLIFDEQLTITTFEQNVKISLEGGEIEGIWFTRNPGLGPVGIDANDEKLGNDDTKEYDSKEIKLKEESVENLVHDQASNNVQLNPVGIDAIYEKFEGTKESECDLNGIAEERSDENSVLDLTQLNNIVSVLEISVRTFQEEWRPCCMFTNNGRSSRANQNPGKVISEKNGVLDNWLVQFFAILRTRKHSKEAVNMRNMNNILWNFKPINYFLGMKWNKR